MIEPIYKCDACKTMRGPGNHWLLARAEDGPWFIEWDDFEANASGVSHLCSAKCAHSILDQWIAKAQERSHGGAQ